MSVFRKEFRNDARVLGINNITLLERPQSAQRDVLHIPYRCRDD